MMLRIINFLLVAASLIGFSEALFEQFFSQQQQRQPNSEPSNQDRFNSKICAGYVCPDTYACVDAAINCPCPFPDSQLKCQIPPNGNNQGFSVCISKGSRGCDFVIDAYKGLV